MSRGNAIAVVCMAFFFTPLCAEAEERVVPSRWTTVWDFRTGRVSGGVWEVSGLTSVQPGPEGLAIRTNIDGKIARVSDSTHPIQALRITLRANGPMQAALRWHRSGTPPDEFSQLPFDIAGETEEETIDLDLSYYPSWDPHADRIGLVFPAGSDLMLVTMELFGWNAWDRMREAVRSFWTFDTLMPYSVNYLWGPRLTFNPIGRLHLFERQPPRAWSGNRIFYAALVLTLLLSVLRRIVRGRGGIPSHVVLIGFAACWLVLDLRMGLEVLSYVRKDATTYGTKEPGERTLRNFGNFHRMLDASAPFLQQESVYAFLAPEGTPSLSQMRYFTYPARPLAIGETTKAVKIWVVYDRPDITVNAEQQLMMGDRMIAPSGAIVKRFDDSSFLFRIP